MGGPGGRAKQDPMEKAKQAAQKKVMYITSAVGLLFTVKAIVAVVFALSGVELQAMKALVIVEKVATLLECMIILLYHGDKLLWMRTIVEKMAFAPFRWGHSKDDGLSQIGLQRHAVKKAELPSRIPRGPEGRSESQVEQKDPLLGQC